MFPDSTEKVVAETMDAHRSSARHVSDRPPVPGRLFSPLVGA